MAKAIVLSHYVPPQVLVPGQVEIGPPAAGQIRVNVRLAAWARPTWPSGPAG